MEINGWTSLNLMPAFDSYQFMIINLLVSSGANSFFGILLHVGKDNSIILSPVFSVATPKIENYQPNLAA